MKAIFDALNSLRIFLTSNLGLKAGALGIAILMFSLVHGAEDVERNVYVDVVVEPPPDAENMILVTEIPDRVRIRLKGSRARLNAIRQENLPPVDVELKSTEESQYYLEKEMFDLPTGVSVVQVVPPSLIFKWVPRAVRSLPVEVLIQGKLRDGLEWASEPEAFPETVEVQGPRDVVNTMRTVRSMEVDASDLPEGVVRRELPLVGPPANTTFDAQTVLVTLHVQPKMKERVLSPLRVDAEGMVPRAIRPRAVTARIRGPETMIDELNPASVLAIVKLTDAPTGKSSISAPVELRGLPVGIEVLELDPATVTVSLESETRSPR
ncbi:MAG: CdaR family protein [Myxococcales bacterium]|nr:CdaR family protein [Myxococcales bacterium]